MERELSRFSLLAGPATVPDARRTVTIFEPTVVGAVTSKAMRGRRKGLFLSTARPARPVRHPQLPFSWPPLFTEFAPSQMRAKAPLALGLPEASTRCTTATGFALSPDAPPSRRRFLIFTPCGSAMSYFIRPVSFPPVLIPPGWTLTVKVWPGSTVSGYSTATLSGVRVKPDPVESNPLSSTHWWLTRTDFLTGAAALMGAAESSVKLRDREVMAPRARRPERREGNRVIEKSLQEYEWGGA